MEGTVFELRGGREMVSGARAEELLQNAPASPTVLRLSNKSLSLEAAQAIAAYIRSIGPGVVTTLDMSDVIAGRPEEEALAVMRAICEAVDPAPLVELNVSDNAVGFKGVYSIRHALTGKRLQRVFLCNNGMSAEAAQHVADLLLQGGCPPLTLLHFYNNMSGNGGAAALASLVRACPGLADLRFSATRSSSQGCTAIADAIGSLAGLLRLDISDNSFGQAAGVALAKGVSAHRGLTHLNLRDAGIGEEGVTQLLLAVRKTDMPLKFLDLSGNDITPDVVEDSLVPALSGGLKLLEELALDDNEITSEGAITLAGCIRKGALPHLQSLSLCTCELTAAGAYTLARAVSRVSVFRRLKVDGNAICARGVEELTSVLVSAGKALEEMEDNDEDGVDDLEDALTEAEAGVELGVELGVTLTEAAVEVVEATVVIKSKHAEEEAEEDELAGALAGVTIQNKP